MSIARFFNRVLLIALMALLATACVPSQSRHTLDTPGGRWINKPDSSPTPMDLNYISADDFNYVYEDDIRYIDGEHIHYIDGNRVRYIDIDELSKEASPSEKTLGKISGPLQLKKTATSNIVLISPEANKTEIEQLSAMTEEPHATAETQAHAITDAWPESKPPLSPGDRLQIKVVNGEEFSGVFEIDLDGTVNLPFLPPIHVAGHDLFWAKRTITQALVNAGFFRSALVSVDVSVQQWSAIQVHVSGAVFSPGMVSVNVRQAEEKILKGTQVSGDFPPDRFLVAALRAAGGVRPDAAVDRLILIRGQEKYNLDLSGHFVGLKSDHIALMAGDQIIVPSTGRFDEGLVRITSITPPGIRLFLSNLTVPATDNSKSQNDSASSSVPYGTRFLTGLVTANCVGGTGATNSARYGVLVTRNPISGETEVIERPIEEIMREPQHERLNPYLMPNDGIACYDSGVTNFRDIGRAISDIISPFR